MLPSDVSSSTGIVARNVDRPLAFDVPDHLGYRVLRWNRYQHMDVVWKQMALLYFALPLPGELPKHLTQMFPERSEKHVPTVLRDEYNVVFVLPL